MTMVQSIIRTLTCATFVAVLGTSLFACALEPDDEVPPLEEKGQIEEPFDALEGDLLSPQSEPPPPGDDGDCTVTCIWVDKCMSAGSGWVTRYKAKRCRSADCNWSYTGETCCYKTEPGSC